MCLQFHNPDNLTDYGQADGPSDDLSYYETELPRVIAGVRRGEKWEIMWMEQPDGEPKWVNPTRHDINYLLDQLNAGGYRVRLAPVPVVKEWDSVEDFPAATVWLRWKNNRKEPMMALGVTEEGIQYAGRGSIRTAAWENMEKLEHSTDLRNWHPCVKTEGGK